MSGASLEELQQLLICGKEELLGEERKWVQ
jgi:hypothetical protein